MGPKLTIDLWSLIYIVRRLAGSAHKASEPAIFSGPLPRRPKQGRLSKPRVKDEN